jgi:hypothetical protein
MPRMAYTVIERSGKEYVRIATKYVTIRGKRIYASERGKECFFINIPADKFNPSKYSG